MRIESFLYPGLGNNAYLVADGASGEAAVVDPQRDVDDYLAVAHRLGYRITHVFDTHLHNDFLSGALEFAQRGATIVASAAAGLRYSHRPVSEGDELEVGWLRWRVLATPGHTPEHVSFLVREEGSAAPPSLFSGGSLMVGTIARTDLLGHEHAPGLARQAHATLHERLFRLPDDTAVYPTHGAGSFCASGALAERVSTIGAEKQRNRFAKVVAVEDFVREALSGLPPYPSYYTRMRPMNIEGPPILGELPELEPLPPARVQERVAGGAAIVDTRGGRAFDQAHISGSLGIALEDAFVTWVGWLLPFNQPLVFVTRYPAHGPRIVRELIRIGFDRLEGFVSGGLAAWQAAGLPVVSIPSMPVSALPELRRRQPAAELVDVRWPDEWEHARIPGARSVPLPELPDRLEELRALGQPLVVSCAGSFRSGIAVSLLERAGVGAIYHLLGGATDWQKAGLPIEGSASSLN